MPINNFTIGEAVVTVDLPDGLCIAFKVRGAQITSSQDIMEHYSQQFGMSIRDREAILSSSSEFNATLAGDVEVLSEGNTKNINTIRIIRFCKRLQGDKNA